MILEHASPHGSRTVATKTRIRARGSSFVAMVILIATLAAGCSTPYGGPGGCLVVGKGSCYTDGQNAPAPR